MADDHAKRVKDEHFRDDALRWFPEVARFALSLTRDESDADDLVQETYLRAYRAWDTYTPGSQCRGWLFTICRHAFYRSRRRGHREVQCDDPELESLAAAAVHASAEQSGFGDLFTRLDLRAALERSLHQLPDQFREAVILVDLEEHAYEDAAAIVGVPVGTIRSRLYRGRRLLQEMLLVHARDAGLVRTAGRPADWEPDS